MPWLMKAEPDSRIVKGKDVKFSAHDFEKIGVSPWDGVRSHEAKNIMKTKMKLGDKVLFYHSNTKVPGVFALAEIAKEGYPDYTAWDPSHPYHDAKSDQSAPTWYMVDVKFNSHLPHPVTLAAIKRFASLSEPTDDIAYIGREGLDAIKTMQLINRGRLSVQPVDQAAYDAIVQLGQRGGWEADTKGQDGQARVKSSEARSNGKRKQDQPEAEKGASVKKTKKGLSQKEAKAKAPVQEGVRRSGRNKA